MKFYYSVAAAAALGYANGFTMDDVSDAMEKKDFNPLLEQVQDELAGYVEYLDQWHNDSVKPFFADLHDQVKDSDVYVNVKDWVDNFEPTTRHDSHRWAKDAIKPLKRRSLQHEYMSKQVHHRVRSMREKLGRPPIPEVHHIHTLSNPDPEYRLESTNALF